MDFAAKTHITCWQKLYLRFIYLYTTSILQSGRDFLQQLRGFYYVAQLGSMGQAAKVMHRSQSSVSRLIKQLEQSLGAELFSRVQKGVVLTKEGEELFVRTVSIFERIRSIHSGLGHVAQEPAGAVSFQASHAAFIGFIAPNLPALCEAYPKLRLNISEAGDFSLLQKRLEERSVDFCLAVGGSVPDNLDFDLLFKDKLVLAAPESQATNIKEPVQLAYLPDLPIIKLPSGSEFSLFVDHHLPQGWLSRRQILVAGNMYYQLNMVAAGLGFAVTAEASLRLVPNLPLASYPLEHIMPPQEYGLVYLHNSYMTPQARAAMEFFRNRAAELNG